MPHPIASTAGIDHAIHVLHGPRVILDEDLARLHGVPTKRRSEAVKRNARRFPAVSLFRLT